MTDIAGSSALPGIDELFTGPSAWHGGPLVGFDLETTGTDPFTDRIVTAAVVGPDEDLTRTWLLDPGVPIPEEAVAVHGITSARAQAEGRPAGVALPEIAEALAEAVAARTPVVVYRAGYDLTMLACELRRHGLAEPDWKAMHVLDPYVMDKQADRWRKGKRTLTDVTAHYGILLDGAHAADVDARAAVALARAIGKKHVSLGAMTAADLCAAQVGWHADDAASLEQFFRSKGRDEVVDRRWPLRLDQ